MWIRSTMVYNIASLNTNKWFRLIIYTGWLVTGGTSGKGEILREKRSRKYRIKIFRLRLCFQENRLWIFAGTIAWPPHSPDLTLLDFYLWSHIKSIVYSEEIASCEQLKEKIIVAFHTLKQSNTLESVHRNLIRRAKVCIRQNGQHFQQFL